MALKKTIYTLVVDNYAPEITALTFPLIRAYSEKIGADFFVIKSRKFPDWPVTYEKLQIFNLAFEHKNDWSIFFDADTLVSPEYFDPTEYIHKDTVAHNGRDPAGIRWKMDDYFRRDTLADHTPRNWGSCNWHSMASNLCLDLWRPLDVTLQEALANIHITIEEHNSGNCKAEHLIDDYTLSRNIARFGLKATTVCDICASMGWRNPANGAGFNPHLWHKYTIPPEQKLREMLAILGTPKGQAAFAEAGKLIERPDGSAAVQTPDGRIIGPCNAGWGIMAPEQVVEYKKKWKVT